ncbi:MAG: interleukin-like EMT inducer domain-containing protein [Acidobacteriota bacterium]
MAKRNGIVLILYLVLALVMTYPLVLQFGDHVPGTTTWSMDEYGYVWNNWWFKHALFDLGTDPFQTNYIFYPIGTSLVLYTFTLVHVLLGLPLQLLFGLIPASNAELLFAFVMSGYGMFLLVQYLLHAWESRTDRQAQALQMSTFAAFTAGAVFAFSSNRFVYASLGHYNVVATEWIPFYILFLVKTVRDPAWSNALLGGLFAALALYVETTDGVLLFLFTLVFLLFAWRQVFRRATLARLVVLGATAAILFAPLLIPTLSEIFASGYTLPGWGHAERLLVDLFGFTTPTSLHPLDRHWVQELSQVRQGNSRFIDVNTVFLGYVTLALAAVGAARYWKTLKVWAASAITFAVLSLGPLLHINGQSVFDFDNLQVTFPLPFLLLHYIPLLRENRVPNRFSVLVMVSLAVLVGFAIAWVIQRIDSKTLPSTRRIGGFIVGSVLLISILFEHAAMPLPLTDARVPEVYAQIAREPGDFAVLTLPLGWRNSFGQLGAEDTRAQYYQSVSNKFTFSGNIQRNPPFLFDYFDRISLFHSLTELEFYREVPDAVVAQDRASASSLLSFFDVRYVVIQPSIPGRPPYSDTRDAVAEYVRNVLPLGAKIYERDGVVAYRVDQVPLPAKLEIGFGKPEAHLYQAEGWDRDETLLGNSINWANRQNARVLFPLRQVADYQVTLRVVPFLYPQSPVQTMQVLVNGEPVEKFELGRAWGTYSATVPARVLHTGLNDLTLQFAYAARPRDVMPANFGIGATGATSPVDIVVNAGQPAADSVEALGSIRVNGREESLLGRGYNVVIVDPRSGRVVDRRVFNTADDRSQSRNLTDLIAEIPNGYIVAVASQEQVAASLGDKTVAALRSLGAQVDIRQTPNRSHALIGVKGSAPGTAVEQSNEGASFISVGHVTDERTLAAAVSEITIEKK